MWHPRPTAPRAPRSGNAQRGTQFYNDAWQWHEGDYLPCLFFADDGVLIATDRVTLQEMTEFLADALADVGLFLNAGKTSG